MNSKPENRIPWLFTDFDNIKDFPWFLKISLTFPWPSKIFVFPWLFPDRGNPDYLCMTAYKHNAAGAIHLAPDVCKLNNAVDKSLSSG